MLTATLVASHLPVSMILRTPSLCIYSMKPLHNSDPRNMMSEFEEVKHQPMQ